MPLEFCHIDAVVAAGRVIERVRISGVEVNEAGNSFGVSLGNRAEFLSSERMTDENRMRKMQ